MPVYEYKCVECDERFEVEQSMKDAPLKKIKGDDHTHKVKKVFSPVGISFKGSGFYKNDSAGKKKTSPTSTSSTDSKATASESKSTDTSSKKSSEKTATKTA